MRIYHYTNFELLALIPKNRTIRFSRLDKLDEYEKGIIGQSSDIYDIYFTKLIKSIRADLKLNNKELPIVGLKNNYQK